MYIVILFTACKYNINRVKLLILLFSVTYIWTFIYIQGIFASSNVRARGEVYQQHFSKVHVSSNSHPVRNKLRHNVLILLTQCLRHWRMLHFFLYSGKFNLLPLRYHFWQSWYKIAEIHVEI